MAEVAKIEIDGEIRLKEIYECNTDRPNEKAIRSLFRLMKRNASLFDDRDLRDPEFPDDDQFVKHFEDNLDHTGWSFSQLLRMFRCFPKEQDWVEKGPRALWEELNWEAYFPVLLAAAVIRRLIFKTELSRDDRELLNSTFDVLENGGVFLDSYAGEAVQYGRELLNTQDAERAADLRQWVCTAVDSLRQAAATVRDRKRGYSAP